MHLDKLCVARAEILGKAASLEVGASVLAEEFLLVFSFETWGGWSSPDHITVTVLGQGVCVCACHVVAKAILLSFAFTMDVNFKSLSWSETLLLHDS
eukprot:3510300-Amphidinium_carterae.1